MANELRTNAHFYKSIVALTKEWKEKGVELEAYLNSLLVRSHQFQNRQSLTLTEWFNLLEASFEPFSGNVLAPTEIGDGFEEWKSYVERQIKDLQAMRKNKSMFDPSSYFGINAPSGQRWYNFTPISFLECAAIGSFGGWEFDDDSDRVYVPGKVAVLNDRGEIETCDPRELDDPPVEIHSLTWEELTEFLWNGQHYE